MVTKSYLRFLSAMGAAAVALAMVPTAFGCGLSTKLATPAAWHPQLGGAHLLTVSTEAAATPSIVGMWHVIFTANTSNGTAIPNTVIDNALVVWHNDNTETMNSVRPPQDGNFCLGVWEQTGPLNYRLNHFAWFANEFPNATSNGIGAPVGPTRFVEWATLSSDGNHYNGTFGLYSHDTTGKPGQSFTGTITATRITMNTSTADLF